MAKRLAATVAFFLLGFPLLAQDIDSLNFQFVSVFRQPTVRQWRLLSLSRPLFSVSPEFFPIVKHSCIWLRQQSPLSVVQNHSPSLARLREPVALCEKSLRVLWLCTNKHDRQRWR